VEAVADEEEGAEVLGLLQRPRQQRPRQPMGTHPQRRPPLHGEEAEDEVVDEVEIRPRLVLLHRRRLLQLMAL
jgi:hypothetical protein